MTEKTATKLSNCVIYIKEKNKEILATLFFCIYKYIFF